MSKCSKKKIHCALCSEPGVLECKYCHYVLYCEKHRLSDWNAIHHRICDSLKQLQKPVPTFVTDIERQQYRDKIVSIRHYVLHVCTEYAKKLLFFQNFKQAVPAVMQELRWVKEIYGTTSVEIIPTYCRVVQGCLGIGRLDHAEDYMSQALWCYQKREPSTRVKFFLFKVLGQICEIKEKVDEARDALAEHLFYAAEEWGPESIQTMWGYFHMGLSFLDKPAAAYSFFAKVIKVVNSHLTPKLNFYFDQKETEEFVDNVEEGSHTLQEQLEMLVKVRSYIVKVCREFISIHEICALLLALGTLHHFCATDKASPYLQQVIEIAQKLRHYETTLAVAKKLLNKEELRLKEWLRQKMTDASVWEGLPGTWHDIDLCFSSSTESHSEMIKYYRMIDDKTSQAASEVKQLAVKIQMDSARAKEKREAGGKDEFRDDTTEESFGGGDDDDKKFEEELAKLHVELAKSSEASVGEAAELQDVDGAEEQLEDNATSDEDEDIVGMPSRSLSGSGKTPTSHYYLSYIK